MRKNERKRILASILLIVLLLSLMPVIPQTVSALDFPDIADSWAKDDIQYFVNQGWIKGYPNGTFGPNNNITRAEFVAIVNNAYSIRSTGTNSGFSDVKSSDWFAGAVTAAVEAGYVKGYQDNSFGPNRPITRQEAAAIIARLLNLNKHAGNALSGIKDVTSIADWAKDSVNALIAYKIIKGYPDGTFGGTNNITRAESVAIIKRAYQAVSQFTGIQGMVISNGEPVAGANVYLLNKDGSYYKATMTDNNGSYRFTVAQGEYGIFASKVGRVFTSDKVKVRDKITTIIEANLEQGIRVCGKITDKNGEAIKNEKLYFEYNPFMFTTTEYSGGFDTYLLPNRSYKVFTVNDGKMVNVAQFNLGNEGKDLGIIKTTFSIGSNGGSSGTAGQDDNDLNTALLALEITYASSDSTNSVTKDITLPTRGENGVEITWSSSDESVILNNGYVQRPTAYGVDTPVTLTAMLTKGSVSKTKTFNVIVLKEPLVGNIPVITGIDCKGDWVQPNQERTLTAYAIPVVASDVLTYIWSADAGTIIGSGSQVIYRAPAQMGEATITLTVKDQLNRSSSMSFVLSVQNPPTGDLMMPLLEENADTDNDGLLNGAELKLGTNPYRADTDNDGLTDKQEIELGTNPCNQDTDGDGILDGVEVQIGTNPLIPDPANTTYTINKVTNDNAKIEITGHGLASENDFEVTDNCLFTANANIFSRAYKFTCRYTPSKIVIELPIDIQKVKTNNIPKDSLAIYQYDFANKGFKKLTSTVSAATVKTTITDFPEYESYYVAGVSALQNQAVNGVVAALAFDTTASLEQLIAGRDLSTEYSAIINNVNKNYQVCVLDADATQSNLLCNLTFDRDAVRYAIKDMPFNENDDIVNQYALLNNAISTLDGQDGYAKIVVLTLASYNSSLHNQTLDLVKQAVAKGYIIYLYDLTDDNANLAMFNQLTQAGVRIETPGILSLIKIPTGVINHEAMEYSEYIPITALRMVRAAAQAKTIVRDTSFDISTNGYDFDNFTRGSWGYRGGVCAGMAFTSILNFYELLPARMIVNKTLDDALATYHPDKDNLTMSSSLNVGSAAYSVINDKDCENEIKGFVGGQTYLIKDSGFFRSKVSSEIRNMLTIWWAAANDRFYLQSGQSDADAIIINDLSQKDVDIIMGLIDQNYPIFVGMSQKVRGHAVVAIGYVLSEDQNTLKLHIYDNNYSGNTEKYITLSKIAGQTNWSFAWSNYGWNSANSSSTSFWYCNTEQMLVKLKQNAIKLTPAWDGTDLTMNALPDKYHNLFVLPAKNNVVINNTVIKLANQYTDDFYCIASSWYNDMLLPDLQNGVIKMARKGAEDLLTTAWYYQDVKKALDKGIMSGYPDGTFRPRQVMTKAEFVVTLCRTIKINCTTSSAGHWAENYMALARQKGWIDASWNNTGIYNQDILRADAIQLIWNILSSPEAKQYSKISLDEPWIITPRPLALTEKFDKKQAFNDQGDLDPGKMFADRKEAVRELYTRGLIDGIKERDGQVYLEAWLPLDRATCCAMILRCLK